MKRVTVTTPEGVSLELKVPTIQRAIEIAAETRGLVGEAKFQVRDHASGKTQFVDIHAYHQFKVSVTNVAHSS